MKNNIFKKLVILSVVLILIGFLLLGIGIAKKGNISEISYYHWPFSNHWSVEHLEEHNSKLDSEFSEIFKLKENVDLEVDAVDVDIVLGNENKIEARNIVQNDVCVNYEGNKTNIKIKNHNHRKSYVRIVLNSKQKINELELDVDAGSVDMESIILNKLDLSCDAGEIEVKDIQCNDSKFDVDAGSISIDGILKKFVQIDCNAGDVKVNMQHPKNSFSYRIKSNVSDIILDQQSFNEVSVDKDVHVGTPYLFDIQCNAGSVEINFK